MKIHSEIKPPLKVGKPLTVLKFCTNLNKGPFIYYSDFCCSLTVCNGGSQN